MIANAYKARTTKDKLDTNIPLSVQPWGIDGEKRRYWLVEGQNDTHFRVYRETDPHKTKRVKWFSVAGDIEELRGVATKLEEEDGRFQAKTLGERMVNAIPRLEVSEGVSRLCTIFRLCTDNAVETPASRVPSAAQGCLHPPRPRFLPLRRPHTWQAPAIHILRR